MTKQKGFKIFGCILIAFGVISIGVGIWQGVFVPQTVPIRYDWSTEDFDENAITLDELKEQSEEQAASESDEDSADTSEDESQSTDEPSSDATENTEETVQEEGETDAE